MPVFPLLAAFPGIRWARLARKVAVVTDPGKNIAIAVHLADSD
jgi:hypothetical protein